MDERVDLSALKLDEGRRELLVAAIMANAAPELARRRAVAGDESPFVVLTQWARPALAAAAVLAVVCISVLSLDTDRAAPGYGLADALAVPEPADAWLVSGRAPTVGDVLLAMEGEAR